MNLTLLVLNGMLIASTYALSKLVIAHDVAPATVLLWQVVPTTVVVFSVACALGARPRFQLSLIRYYVIAGLLGLTVPYIFTYQVLQYLPTGVVGVAGSLSAVFTYALARIVGLERPGFKRLAGLVLGMSGVLAIILPKGALPAPELEACVFVALLAPLSLAGGNLYRSMHWPAGAKPLALAAGMLVTQSVVAFMYAVGTESDLMPALDSIEIGAALVAIGVLSSVFYILAFELQRRTEPVFVSQMGYVISLGSLLIGIAFLGERPSPWVWIAALAVVGGIALVIRRPPSSIRHQ